MLYAVLFFAVFFGTFSILMEIDSVAFALVSLGLIATVGFTMAMRKWFLRRDGHRCQFHTLNEKTGKWERCSEEKHLQIHHIMPRGFGGKHYKDEYPLNGPGNGVTLCRKHHINYGRKVHPKYTIHPDNEDAREAYNAGDKDAYKKMMDKRREKNERGEPYWNTLWDWMFRRIVDRANGKMQGDPYPENRNRGRSGYRKRRR